jgi:hypothetical protein
MAADPLLLQPWVNGDLLRILFLDNKVLAAGRLSGVRSADHRSDEAYQSGELAYVPMTLGPALLAALLTFIGERALGLCSVEVIQPSKGEPIFLECNVAPAWLELEKDLGLPLTEQIAEHLCGR